MLTASNLLRASPTSCPSHGCSATNKLTAAGAPFFLSRVILRGAAKKRSMPTAVSAMNATVLKSPNDNKQYRLTQLSSGLTVLLISDASIAAQGQPGLFDNKAPSKKRKVRGSDEDEDGGDNEEEEEDSGSEGMDEEDGGGTSEDEDESMETGSEEDSDSESEEGSAGSKGGRQSKGRKGKGSSQQAMKKAAAAMAVGIGSLSDPDHMPGLSHYLEHMLFMGSTKFPDENEYDEYLTNNGGSSNAYTELETTNYHFEVAPGALQGALDRFAQFFTSPLCLEGSLEREVLAVDSEFSGVKQDDDCRGSQLMCHTAAPGHVYRKFTWGNKKSLWDIPRERGVDIRKEVLAYYHKHYTAERMSLVLQAGESLDTLQGWVEDHFKGLPSGKGERPMFSTMGMPFKGRTFYIMPAVREMHEVTITFQLPCLYPHYGAKADNYISHLVGHEGPGSLLSLLKGLGWATEVSAGIDTDGYSSNSGCSLFAVTITLTEAGLAAGPGFGLATVASAFEYLNMLRNAGPKEWVWQETRGMSDMRFRFQEEEEPMDFCTKLASSLHLYRPEHVLAAEYVHEAFNPELITSLLQGMHPSQSDYRVDLQTSAYPTWKAELQQQANPTQTTPIEKSEGLVWDSKATVDTEPWFDIEATWVQLPTQLVEQWATSAPSSKLHFPPPNPYIPTDFSVRCLTHQEGENHIAEKATLTAQVTKDLAAMAAETNLPLVLATPPELLKNEPGLKLWYKLDCSFQTPRTNLFLRLSSPAWSDTPQASALTHLAIKLLEDELTEDAYLADLAGLYYSCHPEGFTGVEIKVYGFSHKLSLLAQRVVSALMDGTFPHASFSNIKEALERKYRNTNMQVEKHANYERVFLLCANSQHWSEIAPFVGSATMEEVAAHVKRALSKCHLEALVHGNASAKEATALSQSLHEMLGQGCCQPEKERLRDHCCKLPAGKTLIVSQPTRNEEELNCCVEVYYQVGLAMTPHSRALADLVDQLVFEPAYNTLRTIEQLGYTVHSGVRLTQDVIGFCVVVVSANFSAVHVESRVEAFLAGFETKLESMDEAELEKQKAALIANKLTPDRALSDETNRHWDQIWREKYDFTNREAEVKAIHNMTMADVRAWFRAHLSPVSVGRRRAVVKVVPVKDCPASSAVIAEVETNGGPSPPKDSTAKEANIKDTALASKGRSGKGAQKAGKAAKVSKGKGGKDSKPADPHVVVPVEDSIAFKKGCETY